VRSGPKQLKALHYGLITTGQISSHIVDVHMGEKLVRHETVVKCFKKCAIRNAFDGTEGDTLGKGESVTVEMRS
jgi:hypothetical protein